MAIKRMLGLFGEVLVKEGLLVSIRAMIPGPAVFKKSRRV
jgi:hypothetical protein